MSEVKVGDRLEDHEGNVWTVAEVMPTGGPPHYAVLLERMKPVETWAGLDDIGPRGRRSRPATETSDG